MTPPTATLARPANRPASRAEHRTAIERAPLVVVIEQTYTVRTQVDLVSFFEAMDPSQRAEFFALNLASTGHAEWERPLAYLAVLAETDTEVVEPFLTQLYAISTISDGDLGDTVERRGGDLVSGQDRRWSQADYQALCGAVGWLRPPDSPSPEDLARIPGPLDTPMF